MANPNDNLRRLYQNGLKHFSLPDFDTFQQDMKDEEKRKRFYTNMQAAYSLPDFNTFSKDIGAVEVPVSTTNAQPQQTASTVQPITDNTAQQATVQPTQAQGQKLTPMQQMGFQMQIDEMNARMRQQKEQFDQRMEGIKKGNKPGAFMGEREFNPTTGKMETHYYTTQGERVGSMYEQSQRNTEYNQWWENNTEEGRRHKEQRLQREFDEQLETLWQRHNPAEGENAAEKAWSAAEAAYSKAVDKNRDAANLNLIAAGNSSDAVAIKQLETIDNFTDRLTTHDLDNLMNTAWNNLGEDGQKALIDDCYQMLRHRNPGADEIVLYNQAKEFARQQSDIRLYNLAVEKNLPKNSIEYLMRKIGDMNLVMNIGKGIAVNRVGKTGDMAAYEAANEQYRQDGHKILDVTGTVAGFALDPTTWLSAGVGSTAAKGAMWAGGRYLAGRGASAAVTQAATRQFATSMTGRIVGGVVGGAANFGTFEGVKEMENQFAHGGHIVGQDETGRYINEGYSAGAVGKEFGHGLVMGGAIGWLGPVSGNVSDKLVRGTASTIGKVAGRAGVYTGATMAEGTIFSVPEWIEGDRDGFDVWTDNMAMMVGFKAKHILKSAGGVLSDLKASFDSPTNSSKNRLDFESRLRMRMDAPSDGGMALTKDEKAELERYGYDLRDLVESAERTGDAAEGGIIAQNAPEIVSRLTDMVTDTRISEAARAKMYYYATGRKLPMSTIMRGELFEDGKGGFIVESQGANGVITSRSFKKRKEADLELERINRQAELNSIEIGERYQQTTDFENRLQEACRTVASENGWDMVEVYRTCEEARRNYLRGGDRQFDEAQQNILRKVMDAMGEFEETGATDAMRGRINEKYGVDIDAAIRKEANRRTQAEQTAIDEYIDELIPDKAKDRPVEDADVEDITNQKLLTDEPEQPVNDISSGKQPIDPRFDGGEVAPDYDPHQPGGEQKPIGRAVMKYQDRPVEILSGRVVVMDDGTMIDNERSDNSIVIRDLVTGEIEMVSPDAILSYEEYATSVDDAGMTSEQSAAPEAPVEEQSKYTSGQIKIHNSDGTETRGVLTGYVDEDGKHEYYVEGDLQHLHYASEFELDNILSEYQPDAPQEPIIPKDSQGNDLAVGDEIVLSAGRTGVVSGIQPNGAVTVDHNGESVTYDEQSGDITATGLRKVVPTPVAEETPTTVPETTETVPNTTGNGENTPVSVPTPVENGNNNGGNIPQNGNISAKNIPAPAEVPQNEGAQPQPIEPTPLQRIPRDEKGEPMFEQADSPETAWDALVEFAEGDVATAKEIADTMTEEKRKAYEKAQKQKPKGKTPSEILASKKANTAELAKAENEYLYWQKMANVEHRRQAVIRSQQEAEARRLAAERAEAEKAEREAREEAARLEREALEGIPEWHMDTPENARKRGTRRFNGQMFTRQEPIQNVPGKEVEVKFSQKDLPKGHVAVIEAEQLQPSHIQGQRNPMFFIEEAQPKNRAESVSMYAAKEMAEGIRPQEITGSATAYTGAPTVNTRGEVIQGNNRSDALRYLWQNNLPEQQQTYKQYLLDNAEQFGIAPEAVNAMQHPVLVNMLDVDDTDAIRLGQMTAQDTESGGIERIKPKNVAQKLGDGMRTFATRLLSSGDDETTFGQLVDRNGTEVLKWMNQVGAISSTQFQSALDSKGNLTAEAKNDLQKVLYQAVFKGGSQQLEEMFDRLPAKAQRAILSTAFRDMNSPFAGRMLPEIQSSIIAYNELMQDPSFESAKKLEETLRAVEMFKRQISLDDRFEQYMPADNFSNFALQLAAMYKASDMSQTTIASYFNQMYDLAQGKKAATLFEEADTTEYPLAEVIRQVLGIDYKPAKNGNNNVANGGADVALRNQDGQGGELRGNEPPASGKQTPAGTEPSERGGGTGVSHDERGGQRNFVGTPRRQQSDLAQEVQTENIRLSEEVDENGRQFVLTTKGELAFGEISRDTGLTEAPILLSEGMITNPATNDGYGLVHIEARHGEQIRKAGYKSVLDFIEEVAKNYDVIKAGNVRDGHQTYRLQLTDKHNNTLMVELSGDGNYWNINTAGIFKTSYGAKNKEIYNRHTTVKQPTETVEASRADEQSGTQPTPRMNAPISISSDDKGTTSLPNDQISEREKSPQVADVEGEQTLQASIDAAASEVNTEPTPAQAEAGNYKKGHITIGEFDITIENPVGSVRKGVDADGKEWSTTMANTYGYIKGTEGVDGDHIDVFLHTDMNQWDGRKAFVVDQTNTDGSFDEHKVMLGFNDKDEAMSAYLANYDETWAQTHPGLRISETNIEDFNKWVQSSHRKTKPFADYSTVSKVTDETPTQSSAAVSGEIVQNYNAQFQKGEQLVLSDGTNITIEEIVDRNTRKISWTDSNGHKQTGGASVVELANALRKAKSTNNENHDIEPAQSAPTIEGNGYKVKPKPYTNKQGKTLDTYLVTFDRDFSKEEMSALRAKAKALKGWYDRDTHGWMLRGIDDAKAFAEEIAGKTEDDVADEAPLSMADMEKPTNVSVKKVDVAGVFDALKTKGDAKLSNHVKPVEQPQPKKRRWVSEEDVAEFDRLHDELRNHFGKSDDMVQEEAASYGKPRPKQMDAEVLRMGTRMTYLMMKGGLRSFADYCEAMKDELPDIFDEMRPHLKSLYAAAQNMEEVMQLGWDEEMDDRKTVKAFDVYNFDKPGAKDIIATAQHTVDEQASQQQTDQIIQSLKDQRNEQRKKEADETSADTETVVDKAETIASEVESKLKTATTEQDAERLSRSIDKELDEVNKRLALLGYYEAEEVDKDFNEAYGYMRNAERKATQDAHNLAIQLAADLGITIDPKDKVRKGKYGFGSKIARSNVAPIGGEVYITLPLAEGKELNIQLSLERSNKDRKNDDLMLTSIMFRVYNPNGKGYNSHFLTDNKYANVNATYDELLSSVRQVVRTYLPDEPVRPATPLTPQLGEDFVQMAGRVAKDRKARKPHVKPEQPIGDLFGGLFDNVETKTDKSQSVTPKNKENEKTNVQPRTEEAGRGGQQPRSDEPLGEGAKHEDERTDGGRMAQRGGEHTVSDTVRGEGVSGLHKGERGVAQPRNTRNNHAERGVDYAPKGEKARIDANLAAIELAKKLLASGATATPKEMEVLRRYSGWGGLGAAFNVGQAWAPNPINKRLRELLTPEEYEAAVMSRNSAYYTPAPIIDAMWDIAKALGFKGGNIVEGSAGIGNIIGLMPTDISERSNIHAVEIDTTTGGILSLLYPDAKVEIQGFENTRIGNGTVDLAITNVPFVTGLHVMDESGDSDLSKKFRDIHDFCIAKNVRKLREGGIGIFITSNGTLDKSQKLRNWLVGDKEGCADVVGVFRMNNQTFGGTAATSDIIVVRKRMNGRKNVNAIDVSTVSVARTASFEDDKGKTKDLPMLINRYFIEHPENMGGEMFFGFEQGDTYRPTSVGLFPARTADQAERMAAWVRRMADMDWETESVSKPTEQTSHVNEALGEGVKEGSMVADSDGNLCVARMGRAVPLAINKNKIKGRTKEECFKDYSEIKDALAEVLKYQTEHEDDKGLQPLLDRLNTAYDTFVERYGNLNKNNNLAWLRNDVDFSSIVALETYSEKGGKDGKKIKTYGKTDIFSRRVVEKESEPAPKNVKDGIIASIYKFGRIDPEYLATQLGKSNAEVKQEIINSGLGFKNPTTGQIEVSYEYLSGNVREKLRQAREANEAAGGGYEPNIKALEAVMPLNIPAHLIEFTLGSSWVEPKLYERYIKERTGLDVKLTNAGGTWNMNEPWYTDEPKNKEMGVRSEKLGIFIPGHKLIEAAITNKTITVSKTVKDNDGTHTETDPAATTACAAKVDEIRQDFKDWAREQMQSDPDLSMRMEEVYNEQFNNSVPKTIPDEFVPGHFGGAATMVGGKPFHLRPHQAKAVIRATTQPVLLAHEVGTGKTYTLITTAMEMRRLGTARKPMIVVQNATVGQFVASAKALYPNAKVLTLEDADRNAEGRRAFYAKIKFNDWDMIVVPQSVFERIPDSIERQTQFIQDKIEEKLLVLEQMKEADPDGKSMIVRSAEREINNLRDEIAQLANGGTTDKKKEKDAKKAAVTRQNAEVKAREMLDRATDDVEDFDSMGIDAVLVDEAHEYKHLGFATAMQRGVKGVDPSYSKKSQGVFLKVQSVLEKTGGKNVVFATGTPISNTAAEIWTFMRYLMPADVMKDYDIYYFDDFVRNFGNLQQMMEYKTNGKFGEVNRFSGYVNLPELVRIWSTVADTVLTREAGGVSDKIPQMEGGKAQDIFLPQTRALRSIMKYVKEELDAYDKMSGKEKKENSHIPLVMYGIAKAAAVDARLVQSDADDDPNSKTNEAVRQTLRTLEETKDYKGTVAIFADNYQNKASGFNLYEDIRKKLINAGVPQEQIVVMKSGMSVKKKLDIFDRVNSGEVRVVMGSTFTLGTGVNIQERLHTLIHLDAPNRPMDYTQRNGRILRQGNLHNDWGLPVRILRFGVEDSLDVTAYQRLKTKGAIADSIMNGKQLMENSMESRSLEEEQDLFGDITAQLSGSEYALLKNQIEKEVRKLTAKQKAWEADQTYIHNRKRQIAGLNKEAEKRIADNKAYLDKVEAATIGDITVGKLSFPSIEAMEDFFTEQNKKKSEMQEQVRKGGYSSHPTTSDIVISVGGFDFHIHTEISRETKQGQQGDLFYSAPAKMTYSCAELGIDALPVKGNLIKNAVTEIINDVVSGEDFRGRIEAVERYIERNNAELQSMSARDGVPFQFSDELAKAEEKLAEYEELMKQEMEAKEAKYAELDKEVEAASNIELTEEDSDEVVSEPVARYSTENSNFASRYETKEGKTISYTSENPESYGVSEAKDGTPNSGSKEADIQRQRDNLLAGRNSGLNTEAGEFSLVERVFTENGSFNFTSGEKIESADDVAFIFSALEDAAKEHAFIVYVKNGRPTVVELGMGTFTATMVDIPTASLAYNRIRPDQVYFVHNHPSGNLKCSMLDVQMLQKIEDMCDVPVSGVIINLKTGKYGTFDTANNMEVGHKRTPKTESPLKVHTLDKQIFAPDYDPMAQPLVRMSQDVAQFLNSHRMGDRAKVSFLILSRSGRIVGNIHTPFTEISSNPKEVARYISERVIQFGGESAILYGDFPMSSSNGKDYKRLKDLLAQAGGNTLLDVVRVEGNHTRSANDEGLLYEPGSEYGTFVDYSQTSNEAKSNHAEKLSKKFGTPIRIIKDTNELTNDNADRQSRMRRSKGFYDPTTGEIVVVLPNNANVEDIAETVFHEVVAHKGLREMIGNENYDAFCNEVYDHLKDDIKQQVDEDTTRRFVNEPGKDYQHHRRVAVDELFGRMAEKGFEDFTKAERGIWAKIKAKVLEAINKFLGSLKLPKWVRLGDNELRYMLWRSHEKLRSKGNYVDIARDAVKRNELGLSNDVRFRDNNGETGDIWKDMSVGLQERITNAAIRLSNNQSADLTLRNDAMRAVTNNLQSLLHDMRNRSGVTQSFAGADRKIGAGVVSASNVQAMFDRSTVKRVSDLARILMQNGYLSGMTSGEMQRLLSVVKNATAMHDIADSVQKIMDIMVNNQLRNAEGALRQLLSIRGSKIDARGVEVQGALDVDGQRTMEVVKKAMSLKENDINDRIADALNRMSDPDNTIADQAALEYTGLNMALDYVQNIADSKSEEKALRDGMKTAKEDKDAGRMTEDAYKQYVEATEDAIRKNKIERAESYFNLTGRLSDSLRESVENAKAFREAEKARINKIHHNANSDMEGRPTNEHHKEDWKDKVANNGFIQFLFIPLATFDQIMRVFGNKSANGEGYLWNRFMRGWVDCRNKELQGVKDKFAQLDEKAAELFGKGKTWGSLIRMEAKMPKATVSFWDGGEMRDHELTQGNLLYIYMVDKMTDGRMKLRRMGITESDIADIENFLDPRLKALGDWLQDKFLVATRNEYNETHKRMFGASVAAIENYFPLKILANARIDKEEDVNQQNRPDGITTKTGSIIKRRVNNLALDITGADALSVILDHITQMEHWNAYVEWNRDLNTLRTYKRFRNQVINMTTVYGGGRKLWENFNDLCLMAAGEYRPPIAKLDKSAVNIAKGVTAAKVSFRMFTALKQLLSAPAYAPEVSMRAIAKSIVNPYGDFKWCMENMHIFRERWSSRISGDPRLLKSDMDWGMWRSRVMEISSRIGMTPNAFVDAVTVAIGARAMYETRLKQYVGEGYPADIAEERAKQDATILFNQTQQSSESPFLSTMQVDRSWLSVLFTVFRNASMSYTRQEFDAVRNLKRNLTPGQRAKSVEFMTKQILRDWNIDPDKATDDERGKAEDAAKKRFRRQIKKDVLRLATFGFILEMAWNLGPYLPYIIFGNDDDEKDKMWDDALTHALFGSVEGLTGGDVLSSFGNMAASGEWNWNMLSKDMPLASDINTIANKFIGGKNAEAINDIINLLVQSGVGMNPQSITDAAVAIMDVCGDDPALSHEAAIFVMRVLQVPQSQLDKLYFDEIDMSGEEASKLTPKQLAQRYAEYKVKRGTPLAPWSWGDEERLGKYEELAKDRMKERLGSQGDVAVNEAYADFEERYNAVDKKGKEARALMKTDYSAAARAYAALQQDPDFMLYQRFGSLDKQLGRISKMWLTSKTPEEASLVASTVASYRAGMVKVLQAETVERQQSAMQELTALMNEFYSKYQSLQPRQPNR